MKSLMVHLPDELYAAIGEVADREYRTVEGQVLWLLHQSIYRPQGLRRPRNLAADQAVTARLRELWDKAGRPTLRAVAEPVMISHTSVHEALAGKRVPRWPITERIAMALHATPEQVAELKELWGARQGGSSLSGKPYDPDAPAPLADLTDEEADAFLKATEE
jgi:hypothetical protein